MMAEQSLQLRDINRAINCYKEVLKYLPDDLKGMTSLARLYMQVNDINGCQAICSSILKIDNSNEAASVMMADLSFRQVSVQTHSALMNLILSNIHFSVFLQMNFEGAAYHYSQLLIARSTYWTALARLIEVLRRAATLNNAVAFLERAGKNVSQPNQEGGMCVIVSGTYLFLKIIKYSFSRFELL